ncbi:hypothetical protein [Oleiagrimonas sp. C23AA]|uniref:hypothetical protein n=1 Tax=Oleiagrimonas sp. C23AA TaxID=2719047 RepID=UPI00141F1C8C|nr:hypothetical protein [Oleiagrimonas sp. C23AA]NII12388.1 hypothetical protein [Oleiagrimonas sp. C23AA]
MHTVFRHSCSRRVAMLAALALFAALSGCASTPSSSQAGTPQVTRLTQQQFPATQTVDVLREAPSRAYTRLAQLTITDPTGSASSAQLIAQLSASAQAMGANALVVESVDNSGSDSSPSFNPSGGQMQSGSGVGALTVKALAIRYSQ